MSACRHDTPTLLLESWAPRCAACGEVATRGAIPGHRHVHEAVWVWHWSNGDWLELCSCFGSRRFKINPDGSYRSGDWMPCQFINIQA